MSVEFPLLVDHVDAIPALARLYFKEWGHLAANDSIDRTRDRLQEYANRDKLPLIVLAVREGQVIGAAQLKDHELFETFPDKKYWLGGVLIAPRHRGRGYGAQLVRHITGIAPRFGIRTLHLQTERLDGGLYARLGWEPYRRAKNGYLDVLVMERHLPE